jgi:FPC/CPF motif-containing protein YcgG
VLPRVENCSKADYFLCLWNIAIHLSQLASQPWHQMNFLESPEQVPHVFSFENPGLLSFWYLSQLSASAWKFE